MAQFFNFVSTTPYFVYNFSVSLAQIPTISAFLQSKFYSFRSNNISTPEIIQLTELAVYYRLERNKHTALTSVVHTLFTEVGIPTEIWSLVLLLPNNGFLNVANTFIQFDLSSSDILRIENLIRTGNSSNLVYSVANRFYQNKVNLLKITVPTSSKTYQQSNSIVISTPTVSSVNQFGALSFTTGPTSYTIYSNSTKEEVTLSLCLILFFLPSLSAPELASFNVFKNLIYVSQSLTQIDINLNLNRCLFWYYSGNGLQLGSPPVSGTNPTKPSPTKTNPQQNQPPQGQAKNNPSPNTQQTSTKANVPNITKDTRLDSLEKSVLKILDLIQSYGIKPQILTT